MPEQTADNKLSEISIGDCAFDAETRPTGDSSSFFDNEEFKDNQSEAIYTNMSKWSTEKVQGEVKKIVDVFVKDYMDEALKSLGMANSNVFPITISVWRNIALK